MVLALNFEGGTIRQVCRQAPLQVAGLVSFPQTGKGSTSDNADSGLTRSEIVETLEDIDYYQRVDSMLQVRFGGEDQTDSGMVKIRLTTAMVKIRLTTAMVKIRLTLRD